jgi:uncharacterized protein with FMN-binding domain
MKRTSKEISGAVILAAGLAFAAAGGLGGCKTIKEIESIRVENVDPAAVKDGEYDAFVDYKLVTARVVATVRGGRIESIRLIEHSHGPKHGAYDIVNRVLEKQSLEVEAVSGASGSSRVVLKAIETALRKGTD